VRLLPTENESGEYLMSVPDSPPLWRAVPCPKKRSSEGVTHWMFTRAQIRRAEIPTARG
jgi:hypothetical protein